MKRPVITPTCHPERKHRAKGLCNACYLKSLYPAGKNKYYLKNREKYLAINRQWRIEHPKRFQEFRERYAANNPEKIKQNRDFQNARRHGVLTKEEFAVIDHLRRTGMCEICGIVPNPEGNNSGILNMDHCHKTHVFRGLLCHNCNSGLGHFKDNPTILQAAIDYLAKKKLTILKQAV